MKFKKKRKEKKDRNAKSKMIENVEDTQKHKFVKILTDS